MMNRSKILRYVLYVVLVCLVLLTPADVVTKTLVVGVPAVIIARRYLAAHGTSFRALLHELRWRGGRLDH